MNQYGIRWMQTINLKKQWKHYWRTKMPDLQTEIFTKVLPNLHAIQFDDTEETTATEEETPMQLTVTEAVFNHIRANPNQKIDEITKAVSGLGYIAKSVSSLTYQMVRAGILAKDEDRCFTACVDTLPVLSLGKLTKIKEETERKEARKQKRLTATTAPKEDAEQEPTHVFFHTWEPEDVVNPLTLVQAIAVHKYLQKVFGSL
jgi:hypothetical protein